METAPKYVLRKIRPIAHYDEFVSIPVAPLIVSKRILHPDCVRIKNAFNKRIYEYIPEFDSYSDGMKKAIYNAFSASIDIETRGKTKITRVMTFINWVLGSYVRRSLVKEPNVFDHELAKELSILQKENWPTLQ